MQTISNISRKHKALFIFFIVAVILLQSTVSTPALKTLGVGSEAPDIQLVDLGGTKQSISTIGGGKLTLLVFWASWSNSSAKALKQMEEFYKKYKDLGLSVVGINVERQSIDPKTVAEIVGVVDKLKLSFPILIDHGLTAFHDYGVIAVPTTVIVDNDKKIKFEMSGWSMVSQRELIRFVTTGIEGNSVVAADVMDGAQSPKNNAERYWNMGIKAMKSKRQRKSAEKWLKKAIKADPDFILPYLSLGSYYRKTGQEKAAKEQFEKALKLQSDNVAALGDLALILMEEGNNSSAKELVEKAIKEDEAYTPGYYYLAYLTGKAGDMQRATELFSRAEEINPLDYRINVYRGKLFEAQDNREQAAISYKNALKILLHL